MKAFNFMRVLLGLVIILVLSAPLVQAATDGYYQSSATTSVWDGTAADRLLPETPDSYQFDYGDDALVTYTLPWNFRFYGTAYEQIKVDADGNIWFGTPGGHTFPLATTGPVIAAWNTDLSSYYHGGVFVGYDDQQPDRVVVHWRAETFKEAGYGRDNEFEIVLFRDDMGSMTEAMSDGCYCCPLFL